MEFKERTYEVSEAWSTKPPKKITTRAGSYDGIYWSEADIEYYEKLRNLLHKYNTRSVDDDIRKSVDSLIQETDTPVRKKKSKESYHLS